MELFIGILIILFIATYLPDMLLVGGFLGVVLFILFLLFLALILIPNFIEIVSIIAICVYIAYGFSKGKDEKKITE